MPWNNVRPFYRLSVGSVDQLHSFRQIAYGEVQGCFREKMSLFSNAFLAPTLMETKDTVKPGYLGAQTLGSNTLGF